ncbi:MAG: hypothetical protein K8S27_14310 [Candidatus Omnitrophica bacterium]|nr:hypothetical protein [Candidatus Omnitrophota bacterium]
MLCRLPEFSTRVATRCFDARPMKGVSPSGEISLSSVDEFVGRAVQALIGTILFGRK